MKAICTACGKEIDDQSYAVWHHKETDLAYHSKCWVKLQISLK